LYNQSSYTAGVQFVHSPGELAALYMALLWIKENYERDELQQDIVN